MRPADRNRAGWGDDWITCPECFAGLGCNHCGGGGGWPASATRFDDEPEEAEDPTQFQEAAE